MGLFFLCVKYLNQRNFKNTGLSCLLIGILYTGSSRYKNRKKHMIDV